MTQTPSEASANKFIRPSAKPKFDLTKVHAIEKSREESAELTKTPTVASVLQFSCLQKSKELRTNFSARDSGSATTTPKIPGDEGRVSNVSSRVHPSVNAQGAFEDTSFRQPMEQILVRHVAKLNDASVSKKACTRTSTTDNNCLDKEVSEGRLRVENYMDSVNKEIRESHNNPSKPLNLVAIEPEEPKETHKWTTPIRQVLFEKQETPSEIEQENKGWSFKPSGQYVRCFHEKQESFNSTNGAHADNVAVFGTNDISGLFEDGLIVDHLETNLTLDLGELAETRQYSATQSTVSLDEVAVEMTGEDVEMDDSVDANLHFFRHLFKEFVSLGAKKQKDFKKGVIELLYAD